MKTSAESAVSGPGMALIHSWAVTTQSLRQRVLIDGPPSSVRQLQRPGGQGINMAIEWARDGQTPTPAPRFA